MGTGAALRRGVILCCKMWNMGTLTCDGCVDGTATLAIFWAVSAGVEDSH